MEVQQTYPQAQSAASQRQLFVGTVDIRFKHDDIVQGTRITVTGMAGILFTWVTSLNKR